MMVDTFTVVDCSFRVDSRPSPAPYPNPTHPPYSYGAVGVAKPALAFDVEIVKLEVYIILVVYMLDRSLWRKPAPTTVESSRRICPPGSVDIFGQTACKKKGFNHSCLLRDSETCLYYELRVISSPLRGTPLV